MQLYSGALYRYIYTSNLDIIHMEGLRYKHMVMGSETKYITWLPTLWTNTENCYMEGCKQERSKCCWI